MFMNCNIVKLNDPLRIAQQDSERDIEREIHRRLEGSSIFTPNCTGTGKEGLRWRRETG
jgi:hypothetical protein